MNNSDRIAFTINLFGKSIDIYWYAIILTSGMLCALFLLMYLMKKKKDEYIIDDALEIFLFAIPFAIVFARLGYILPRPELWGSFFDFRDGGLTIVVGVPGGALGVLIYCLIRKKSPVRVFDTMVPCLLLGQVIGRWGNFVNHELYGLEITNEFFQRLPFAVPITDPITNVVTWHCANFFYESFFNFIALVVVLIVMKKFGKKIKVGTITVGYIVWYGILRGTLEFVKINQMTVGGIRVIQLICYIVAVIGIILMILLQKGIISFETDKMRKNHFITPEVVGEIMSNNNDYISVKEVEISEENTTDSLDEVNRDNE